MATTRPAAVRLAASLRPALERLVASAARRVVARQLRLRAADVRRKGPGDFVTVVDQSIERQLRTGLARLLPASGFLGEESTAAGLDREWLWVVDPVDGTSNYSRQLPHFAVAVALLWRGEPHLACIHCAPEQELYSAVLGRGTRRGGRRLRMPPPRLDDGAVLGVQWFRTAGDLRFLIRLQQDGARLRALGSTVAQLAAVACGRLDANIQQPGRIWDLAAAGLIATEAGAKFTDWGGRSVFPFRDLTIAHRATVAAGPSIHRKLLRWLADGPVVPPA